MKRINRFIFFAFIVMFLFSCNEERDDHNKGKTPPPTPSGPTAEQPIVPRKELRGVWMATVWGLDWPMGKYDQASQKELYLKYLDLFKDNNINAVFFQVRGMADAYYASQYEPWSKSITGQAGVDPGYDILRFLIEEAHKRNIAFHAWINPYRISTRTGSDTSFPKLDSKIPANLVKDYNKYRIYNPALPAAQDRIVNIVKELITKYNVDGVHMDDYFYPYLSSGEGMNDQNEYATYGRAFNSIEDFRRDNVNKVVKKLHDMIKNTNPNLVFSIGPGGNIENNMNLMFADVAKWSKEGWVDVIIPQLYFHTGNSIYNFDKGLARWSNMITKSKLVIGYGIYKFGDSKQGSAYMNSSELTKQMRLADEDPKVMGGLFYSAKYLFSNPVNIMSAIKQRYKDPVLMPYLLVEKPTLPNAPKNLKIMNDILHWDAVSGCYYAVYLSTGSKRLAKLIATTKDNNVKLSRPGTYFVTAVNEKNNAESKISDLIKYGN